MYSRTDTITNYFLCLVGHLCMVFTVLFNQEGILESAIIGDADISEESRIGLTVCLTLTIILILLEFSIMCIKITPITQESSSLKNYR
ncbi:unnamed protein product [Caenorhabditis angaria]|uniref:Uncharacterized protein n=1 Tax=Caenorhabditis angaria TaxID=860376 RepID=A0A9P1I4K4_9PELO|nr:unnamed protein product [Caenorhabditis angaria]